MKYVLFLLLGFIVPAAAQAPSDAEIAAKWELCKPHEVQGMLAKQHPWQPGWGSEPGGANCGVVRDAYASSPAALAAKEAAKKEDADKASIKELSNRLKGDVR